MRLDNSNLVGYQAFNDCINKRNKEIEERSEGINRTTVNTTNFNPIFLAPPVPSPQDYVICNVPAIVYPGKQSK